MTGISPCKDCVAPKRHVGCHATCKEYIDWKDEWDQEQDIIRRKKHEENLIRSDIFKKCRKKK